MGEKSKKMDINLNKHIDKYKLKYLYDKKVVNTEIILKYMNKGYSYISCLDKDERKKLKYFYEFFYVLSILIHNFFRNHYFKLLKNPKKGKTNKMDMDMDTLNKLFQSKVEKAIGIKEKKFKYEQKTIQRTQTIIIQNNAILKYINDFKKKA